MTVLGGGQPGVCQVAGHIAELPDRRQRPAARLHQRAALRPGLLQRRDDLPPARRDRQQPALPDVRQPRPGRPRRPSPVADPRSSRPAAGAQDRASSSPAGPRARRPRRSTPPPAPAPPPPPNAPPARPIGRPKVTPALARPPRPGLGGQPRPALAAPGLATGPPPPSRRPSPRSPAAKAPAPACQEAGRPAAVASAGPGQGPDGRTAAPRPWTGPPDGDPAEPRSGSLPDRHVTPALIPRRRHVGRQEGPGPPARGGPGLLRRRQGLAGSVGPERFSAGTLLAKSLDRRRHTSQWSGSLDGVEPHSRTSHHPNPWDSIHAWREEPPAQAGPGTPPRVQITYDVETNGSPGQEGAALRARGHGRPRRPPRPRQGPGAAEGPGLRRDQPRLFGKVMAAMEPRLALRVDNELQKDGTKIGVVLKFESIDDFEPENVVNQVEPLRQAPGDPPEARRPEDRRSSPTTSSTRSSSRSSRPPRS